MDVIPLDYYDVIQDYISQQELDRLIQRHDDVLRAYQNAVEVLEFYKQRGITKDFLILIGDESLIANAKEAVKNFIDWIKQIIRHMVAFVLNLITKIRLKLIPLLHLEGNDRLIKIRYDISAIEQNLFVLLNDPIDCWINRPEQIEITERLLKEQSTDLTHLLNTTVSGNAITAVRLKAHAEVVCKSLDMVNKYLPSVTKLTGLADKLNANDPATLQDIDRLISAMYDTIKINHMKINDVSHADTIDDKLAVCNTLLKLLLLRIKYTGMNVNTLEGYLINLRRAYMNDEIDVHLSFIIPPDMCERLGKYYGGTFKVNCLVVTNRDPRTWPDPISGLRSPISGWMFENAPVPNIWCNYNFLMSSVSRWSRLRGSKEESLIKTIVHECRHLFDIQNGASPEFTREDNVYDYKDRTYESRARYAADHYHPTQADIAFAKKVLYRLNEEVKRQAR